MKTFKWANKLSQKSAANSKKWIYYLSPRLELENNKEKEERAINQAWREKEHMIYLSADKLIFLYEKLFQNGVNKEKSCVNL